ncbi:MAG: hypothetical protein KTR32_01580 [Granulosicoccus sp.]|nr:hypothetical protein [Granulosicoccus sp.]
MYRPSIWPGTYPSRGTAFAIHLVLSLLAFSTLVIMMLLFWFPGELFLVDGGWQGLKLVAMVDLVLGPALTLLLYKPGKPKLIFDLSLIAAIQIAALGYGFYTTYTQRTVAIVFAENNFATLSAHDHKLANQELESLQLKPKQIDSPGIMQVAMMVTPPPENYSQFVANLLNGYPEPQQRSDLFIPIANGHSMMQNAQQDEALLEANGSLQAVNEALASRSMTMDDVEVYPYKTRYSSGMALFDPQTLRIIDFVPQSATLPADSVVSASDSS